MAELQQRLADEPELAAAYLRAHESYIADRDKTGAELGLDVPEIAGISAGGMPSRVKCLHALIGHTLAAGPGVNPIGAASAKVFRTTPIVRTNQLVKGSKLEQCLLKTLVLKHPRSLSSVAVTPVSTLPSS
jgi:hypothetical protein